VDTTYVVEASCDQLKERCNLMLVTISSSSAFDASIPATSTKLTFSCWVLLSAVFSFRNGCKLLRARYAAPQPIRRRDRIDLLA
jgi:hypothetical protein